MENFHGVSTYNATNATRTGSKTVSKPPKFSVPTGSRTARTEKTKPKDFEVDTDLLSNVYNQVR